MRFNKLRKDSFDAFSDFRVAGIPPPSVTSRVLLRREDESQGAVPFVADDLGAAELTPAIIELTSNTDIMPIGWPNEVLQNSPSRAHPSVNFEAEKVALSGETPSCARELAAPAPFGTAYGKGHGIYHHFREGERWGSHCFELF